MTNHKNFKALGPWKATITVHSDRRNLFELYPNQEFHICTLVSGNKSEIPRFNHYVSLIEKAPEMQNILLKIFDIITNEEQLSDPQLNKIASEIISCLNY